MSTTDAARESARRPDGQFGVQRRSELDPANAGLGELEAPLPTWEDALAHAETLLAQGVDVSISEYWMLIEIRDDNGNYHDHPDGTPAFQRFHHGGITERIDHWTDGKYHDPDDGTPASQGFYPDGTPKWISHYTDGERHDPADGTPARQCFYPNGSPERISHYTDGELISEERFPPPSGEV